MEGMRAASQNWWLEIPKSLEIRDFGFQCSWNQGDWPMPSNFLLTNGKYVVWKFRWIPSLFQYDLHQTKQKRVQIKLNINLYPYSIINGFDNICQGWHGFYYLNRWPYSFLKKKKIYIWLTSKNQLWTYWYFSFVC